MCVLDMTYNKRNSRKYPRHALMPVAQGAGRPATVKVALRKRVSPAGDRLATHL